MIDSFVLLIVRIYNFKTLIIIIIIKKRTINPFDYFDVVK